MMQHGAVNGRAVEAGNTSDVETVETVADLGDPAADPVLTVRIQPPATRARRLDLGTPRAVKIDAYGETPWVTVDYQDELSLFLDHEDVADWPYAAHVEIGAAQRLAHPDHFRPSSAAAELPADECERPFR